MKILKNLLKKIETAASFVGGLINQNLTKEETKRAFSGRSSTVKNLREARSSILPKKEMDTPKEVYTHKGSGYKGKGSINRDTATFNKPRKGLFQGRNH